MNNVNNNNIPPLKSYPLFWISVLTPFSLAIITSVIIYCDKTPHLCWTKECIDLFIQLFKVPLNLLGLTIVFATLSLTLYRVNLTFSQNERQLKQDTYNNFISFKESFRSFIDETKRYFTFRMLELNTEWLFSALYPNSTQGEFSIHNGVEKILMGDLLSFMQKLESTFNSKSTDQFYTQQYSEMYTIYEDLTSLLPISHKTNFTESNWLFFTDYDANKELLTLISEICEFAKIINAVHSWQWFSYKEMLEWDHLLKELRQKSQQVTILNNHICRIFETEKNVISTIKNPPPNTNNEVLNSTQFRPYKLLIELSDKSRLERNLAYEIFLTHIDSQLMTHYADEIRSVLNINVNVIQLSKHHRI
jgi:hypothetical protein